MLSNTGRCKKENNMAVANMITCKIALIKCHMKTLYGSHKIRLSEEGVNSHFGRIHLSEIIFSSVSLLLDWRNYHFSHNCYNVNVVRDDFKTQLLVDRWFHLVPAGFCCSKQLTTRGNCQSASGWVLKSPLINIKCFWKIQVFHYRPIARSHDVNQEWWRYNGWVAIPSN